MNKPILLIMSLVFGLIGGCNQSLDVTPRQDGIADKSLYLKDVHQELLKKWPENRTVTIVCHGHSVPAGYFNTPTVKPFDSYPHLLHQALNEKYPHSVINVIVTAVGGEHSESGAKRFDDVLVHRPDILLIDYALNDRSIGLKRANSAWKDMIREALENDVKIILLTPTLDVNHIPNEMKQPLNQHAAQIRLLAETYGIGLVDSLSVFDQHLQSGAQNTDFLSNGYNHPNRKGHQLVTGKIMEWF